MVFYFSGTGNSQYVAKQICTIINDSMISINQALKNGTKDTYQSEKPLVFVLPTYGWRMPQAVHNWIKECHFGGNNSAYFILTCGGSTGNASGYAKKLCEEKNLQFCGFASILMPENYIALADVPSEHNCEEIIKKAQPIIEALAERIKNIEMLPNESVSIMGRFLSGSINKIYYRLIVKDKGFNAADRCVSCGKCAKRCPLNNIKMVGGKPVWNGNCTHCMACICGCPLEAIEYKNISKGKRRYYIMQD